MILNDFIVQSIKWCGPGQFDLGEIAVYIKYAPKILRMIYNRTPSCKLRSSPFVVSMIILIISMATS